MDKIKVYKSLNKKDAEKIINILIDYYKDAKCSLNFNTPFQLTVALILAAQCTDERVNKTVPILFAKYKDENEIAKASIKDIENIVRPCGFFKVKAKNIVDSANILVNNYNGIVPNSMDGLCTLKGIGRKSANIILQECFGMTCGIAVDTHVTRISRKMGLSNSAGPLKIEKDLTRKFDKKYWSKINHVLVYHGREICIANRPKCEICPVNHICKKN